MLRKDFRAYYDHMIKRTTVAIDEQLLARAKRALGCSTTRATVEEALRRVAEQAEDEHAEHAARLDKYFKLLAKYCDLEVLASDEMWR
jgi:Arc/MetJ family transcription regulator